MLGEGRPRTAISLLLITVFANTACDSPTEVEDGPDDGDPPTIAEVGLSVAASGFDMPVHLTAPPGDSRLFVVEKGGRIKIVEGGATRATSFLDISNLVSNAREQGLLSMTFHPNYVANGHFYVYYTDVNGASRVVRYAVSSDRNVADAGSAKVILQVAQPNTNHNGGLITFGPDGMLYIGLGDGGGGGDPDDNGQDLGTLLGALLRIDVGGGDPYAIPPDNPFVGDASALDEIWAYGLRNPWRYSFDDDQAAIYIADVGQNTWEEINVESAVVGGLNYGWNTMEGQDCFSLANCDSAGLELPVLQYSTRTVGCAVVGGFVYRGSAINGLNGNYFYSDNCGGWIKSFKLEFGQATQRFDWELGDVGAVLSFGEDGHRELYVLSANGNVYQFVSVS
jgi:glucose/arabinose dehydrogenase